MSDFDDSKTTSAILTDDSLYSVGGNISKKPEIKGDAFQELKQDMTIFDDFESELLEAPEEESLETISGNIKSPRQSRQAQAPWKPYPGQIIYGSAPIPRKLLDNSSQPNLNLASPDTASSLGHLTSTRIVQSNIYMVQTFKTLLSNIDKE